MDVVSWVSKNLKASWSSPALTELVVGKGALTDVLKGFKAGNFESSVRQRVILSLFDLDLNGKHAHLQPEVDDLLAYVESHENNEWALLVANLLRNKQSSESRITETRTLPNPLGNPAPITKLAETVLSSSSSSDDGLSTTAALDHQFYLPLEFSILNEKLLPLEPAFLNEERHFTRKLASGTRASTAGEASSSVERKRPRGGDHASSHGASTSPEKKRMAASGSSSSSSSSSSSHSDARGDSGAGAPSASSIGAPRAAAYVPSERVRAVVGVHDNKLTAEAGKAIERLLDLTETGKTSTEEPKELKLKVHEEIEAGNTRVSIYIRLEFGPPQACWKKIRKAKKLG